MQGYINYSDKMPMSNLKCCSNKYFLTETVFEQEPILLGFLLPDFMKSTSLLLQSFNFDKIISIRYKNNQISKLYLKCIIYFGNSHFTVRLIDRNSDVWYYDSTTNNGKSIKEKNILEFNSAELIQCNMRRASCILYAKNI